jgi:hypothetical protein
LGRTRDARDDVCDEEDVVHSLRIVLPWAMQELGKTTLSATTPPNRLKGACWAYYSSGVAGVDEEAILGFPKA